MSMTTEHTRTILPSGASASDGRGGAVEPWFAILVSSLVPLLSGLFAPGTWRTVLHVLGSLMCVAGLILLVRHEMIVRQQQNVTHAD